MLAITSARGGDVVCLGLTRKIQRVVEVIEYKFIEHAESFVEFEEMYGRPLIIRNIVFCLLYVNLCIT